MKIPEPVSKFDSPDFKRSRAAYNLQCAFEYLMCLLFADAYLAKLLKSLSFSDAQTGLVASFINFAFVFQLLSLIIARHRVKPKTVILPLDTVSQLFYVLVYLVPFLPLSPEMRRWVVVGSVFFAYFLKYTVSALHYNWANSFVDPYKRAIFGAKKELFSTVVGIIFQFAVGQIVDRLEGLGNLKGAFLFIAITMLALDICSFFSIALIGERHPKAEDRSAAKPAKPWGDVLKATFGNPYCRNVLILRVLMAGGCFITGFMGTYKTEDLGLTISMISIINIIGCVARMPFAIPLGKYSDKHGYCQGYLLGMYICAAAYLINAFTTPSRWYFVIAFVVLQSISLAGTNQNAYSMVYSYVPKDFIAEAMALGGCLIGIIGFLFATLGGLILDAIQNAGNRLFGLPVYGQQVLSLIAFLFVIGGIVWTKLVVAKQPAMKQ